MEISNASFHQICPVVPRGPTDEGRADMTKLTVAYRNIANAPTAWYEGVTTQQHQNFYGPHLEDNIAMTSTI